MSPLMLIVGVLFLCVVVAVMVLGGGGGDGGGGIDPSVFAAASPAGPTGSAPAASGRGRPLCPPGPST